MKRTLILLVVCLPPIIGVLGQTPAPSPGQEFSDSNTETNVDSPDIPASPREKAATLESLKAKAKTLKVKDELIFAYDKFTDTSIIASKPDNIVGSWEGAMAIVGSSGPYSSGTPRLLMVGLETRFPAQTLHQSPDRFALVFDGMSPDWQFLKTGDTLYLLLDNTDRIRLEAAAKDTDVKRWNRVDEKIAYIVDRDQLTKIVNAEKAELRIGQSKPREFKPKLRKRWKSLLEITNLEVESTN